MNLDFIYKIDSGKLKIYLLEINPRIEVQLYIYTYWFTKILFRLSNI